MTRRASGSHGVWPLSDTTRRRLLSGLLAKADAGDVPAAESLIRLSFEVRRNGGSGTTGHCSAGALRSVAKAASVRVAPAAATIGG